MCFSGITKPHTKFHYVNILPIINSGAQTLSLITITVSLQLIVK